MEGCLLSYELKEVPGDEYIEAVGFDRNVRVQLEADGTAVLLKVTDSPPVDVKSYAQPRNFPLQPSRACG